MAEAKTYWRCAACGNEILFRVSGGVRIECLKCGKTWTVQDLFAEHKRVHPETS